MDFESLEVVVLKHDLDTHGLKQGDLGTVVEVYEPGGLEVEFVTADGRTLAVTTLQIDDVRKVNAHDLIAVRTLHATG